MTGLTPTLNQLLRIPNYKVFDDFDYICYDRVKDLIISEYGEREIAFETPDLFRRKLNYYLGIRQPVYNKMLESQLIKLDPFITEYIVTEGKASTRTRDFEHEGTETSQNREDNNYSFNKHNTDGKRDETTDTQHTQDTVNTDVTGKLFSRAENSNKESQTKTNTTGETTADYSETKDTTENTTENKTIESSGSNNQTGRTWTEKGDSSGHNLNVHSDTPQAMLFNQPSWLTGAGRTHTEGKLVNGQLQHFAESNPSAIDTASLTFNDGETPWYQYASTGDNNTGHDSYNKEGTETYNLQSTNSQKDDTTKETTGNIETSGNKHEETTKNETADYSERSATAENTNEHIKADGVENLAYKGQETGALTTNEKGTAESTQNNKRKTDTDTDRRKHSKSDENTDKNEIRKGRTMRSPSQLLNDYRSTLNYNADMWLISELEPLFLGIF